MKYSLRSLMTFSIRDLLWLTVVVALAVAWWVERMDRYSSRKELQRVQLRLALEEDNNKHLKNVVKGLEDINAMTEANLKESHKQGRYGGDVQEGDGSCTGCAQLSGTRPKPAKELKRRVDFASRAGRITSGAFFSRWQPRLRALL